MRTLPAEGTLPTGVVTFFFSDIEGSTRLLETLGDDAYFELLARHHEILRAAFVGCAAELGTEGDSFFAVFWDASDAVRAAVAIQRGIAAERWPGGVRVGVRIGLHTGEGRLTPTGYAGLDVHRAARIMAAAHGGQVVLSEETRAAILDADATGARLRDLGEHRLRDLSGRARLFQVAAEGLGIEFPPLRTLDVTPNNLPMQPTPVIGRETELADVRDLLDGGRVRLLTLVGPGGIGKTRIALQAAADQIDRFGDGVYFVDLAPARDAGGVLEAIVRAAGVSADGSQELLPVLTAALAGRSILLVLDNFEHVIGAAPHVAELLGACPRIAVLVTSREALRVRGEQLYRVAPLAIPPGGERTSVGDVERYPAVRLFVERAREARPDFVLDEANAALVADICARLDGLPLALELAAARLRLFSAEELHDRLRSRLEVLRGGARDLPERQRTLHAAIEWSHELLDEEERAVFRLASVFAGTRVRDVEEVAADIGAMAGVDVVERLASLVDKSLVRSVPDAAGQRLSMLETIREYAQVRLEDDPDFATAARAAHARHYTAFAAERHRRSRASEGSSRGASGRRTAIDELASELGNLQLAWRHSLASDDREQLGLLFEPLWFLHESRGWYQGAVALANDLLTLLAAGDASGTSVEKELALRMSLARGLLAVRGYTDEVEQLYRAALAISERAGSATQQLPFLLGLASYHMYRGELDRTIAIGRQLLEIGEQEGDTGLLVEGHLMVGPALAFTVASHVGIPHLERAIALFDPDQHGRARFRLGPNPGVAAHAVAGLMHWMAGRPETGTRLSRRAIELADTIGHPYSRVYATFHVGLLDLWSGRVDPAHEHAGTLLAMAEEHDYRVWQAIALVLQGVTAGLRGEPDRGVVLAERGVALYENLRTPPIFWPLLLTLRAQAAALAGGADDALRILDQAAALEPEGSYDSALVKTQKADVLAGLGRAQEAAPLLRQAIEVLDAQGWRMLQLRAANRLVRVTEGPAREEALRLLGRVLADVSEGVDDPEVVAARAALGS